MLIFLSYEVYNFHLADDKVGEKISPRAYLESSCTAWHIALSNLLWYQTHLVTRWHLPSASLSVCLRSVCFSVFFCYEFASFVTVSLWTSNSVCDKIFNVRVTCLRFDAHLPPVCVGHWLVSVGCPSFLAGKGVEEKAELKVPYSQAKGKYICAAAVATFSLDWLYQAAEDCSIVLRSLRSHISGLFLCLIYYIWIIPNSTIASLLNCLH